MVEQAKPIGQIYIVTHPAFSIPYSVDGQHYGEKHIDAFFGTVLYPLVKRVQQEKNSALVLVKTAPRGEHPEKEAAAAKLEDKFEALSRRMLKGRLFSSSGDNFPTLSASAYLAFKQRGFAFSNEVKLSGYGTYKEECVNQMLTEMRKCLLANSKVRARAISAGSISLKQRFRNFLMPKKMPMPRRKFA